MIKRFITLIIPCFCLFELVMLKLLYDLYMFVKIFFKIIQHYFLLFTFIKINIDIFH